MRIGNTVFIHQPKQDFAVSHSGTLS